MDYLSQYQFYLNGFQENNCDIPIPRYIPTVDTSQLYKTLKLPDKFEHSYILQGYGIQRNNLNPLYRTSNLEYGWYTPCAHTVPQRYFPRTNEFSDLLGKSGMYRNYSLNTVLDKSVV